MCLRPKYARMAAFAAKPPSIRATRPVPAFPFTPASAQVEPEPLPRPRAEPFLDEGVHARHELEDVLSCCHWGDLEGDRRR